ncbi:MAG: glycerol-3-phosphate 1-O-acyltransferase PlsY [Oscillospiraceae bacterium]|jgi:glycerol-3-phosphate acyltransferase PlsY|nr:glycerol-3-phosphate 1-O-acyltransferase PlsY [Oscillospiraceae bacterium]
MLMKILVMAAAYFLGNFNSGIIFSRVFHHKDIRQFGSKNPGTTNAFRVLGKLTGSLVLFADALKGAAAVLLAKALLGNETAPGPDFWPALAGLLVIVGHIYPVLFKFKGGKGVATTAGVTLILQPVVLLLVLIPFLILLFTVKYMSVASVTGALLLPWGTLAWQRGTLGGLFWLALIQAALIVFTHRSNLGRLRNHTENKLFQKKKTEAEVKGTGV